MTHSLVVPDGWRQGAALARLRQLSPTGKRRLVHVSYDFMRHLLTDMLVAYIQHGDKFNPTPEQVDRGVFSCVGQVEVVYDGTLSVDIAILL